MKNIEAEICSKNSKVLICDDDQDLCDLQKEILEGVSNCISVCHDGASALKMMEEKNFDLVITDLVMPNLNGLQFIKKMRKDGNKTPAMVVSGMISEYIKDNEHAQLGIVDTITKPMNLDTFASQVRAALDKNLSNLQ